MKTLLPWMLSLLLLVCAHGHAEATTSAYESVRQSTDALLARLKTLQPVYATNPEKFFTGVDVALAPHVDFVGFSRGVMAKHYRGASEAQRARFERRFRDVLVKTYATVLLEFDNQRVVVQQPTRPQAKPDRAAIVLEVHARSGTVYQIRYQLGLIEGKWLLRNIIINGINVGLQFRAQFNADMQKYGQDIDQAIENWSVDV